MKNNSLEEALIADESHRCKVTTRMAENICALGADAALAIKIVSAIDNGEVPNLSINYYPNQGE